MLQAGFGLMMAGTGRRNRTGGVSEVFTAREREVLACMGERFSDEEAAERLGVKPSTVAKQIRNLGWRARSIAWKAGSTDWTDLTDRQQLASWAIRWLEASG